MCSMANVVHCIIHFLLCSDFRVFSFPAFFCKRSMQLTCMPLGVWCAVLSCHLAVCFCMFCLCFSRYICIYTYIYIYIDIHQERKREGDTNLYENRHRHTHRQTHTHTHISLPLYIYIYIHRVFRNQKAAKARWRAGARIGGEMLICCAQIMSSKDPNCDHCLECMPNI